LLNVAHCYQLTR